MAAKRAVAAVKRGANDEGAEQFRPALPPAAVGEPAEPGGHHPDYLLPPHAAPASASSDPASSALARRPGFARPRARCALPQSALPRLEHRPRRRAPGAHTGAPTPAGPSALPPRSDGCAATLLATPRGGVQQPPGPSSSPSSRGRAPPSGPSRGPPSRAIPPRRPAGRGPPRPVRLRWGCGQRNILPLRRHGVSTFSHGKRQNTTALPPALLAFEPLGFALARLPVCGIYDVYHASVGFDSITRRVDAVPSGSVTRSLEGLRTGGKPSPTPLTLPNGLRATVSRSAGRRSLLSRALKPRALRPPRLYGAPRLRQALAHLNHPSLPGHPASGTPPRGSRGRGRPRLQLSHPGELLDGGEVAPGGALQDPRLLEHIGRREPLGGVVNDPPVLGGNQCLE